METLHNILSEDPDFFVGIPLAGNINPDILADTIISRYGELDVVYVTPKIFKYYQTIFFQRKFDIFRKMMETTQYDYDPIENYNRMEDYWENNDDMSDSESEVNTSDNGTSKVSPYNADTFINDTSTEATGDAKRTATDINERKKKGGIHAHGNIGVTTTQQMIEQERAIIRYDVYEEIAKMWANEFVVQVW